MGLLCILTVGDAFVIYKQQGRVQRERGDDDSSPSIGRLFPFLILFFAKKKDIIGAPQNKVDELQ